MHCDVIHLTVKISTKFEVDTTLRCQVVAYLLLTRYVTLIIDLLILDTGQWSRIWRVVINLSTEFEGPTLSVL